MTEKELKKLNRKQLLELLLKQTEYSEALEERLKEMEKKLEDKILIETEAGSIAEASLKLNAVFEAAQAAADQYLENIKRMSEKQKELGESLERQKDLDLESTKQKCVKNNKKNSKKRKKK